jgi:hypothetical protein
VLSAVLNKETEHWIVVVYIDDVLIGAVDNDALVQAWAWVLTQCAAHKITISAPKTSLGAHEIEALGAVVAHQSIQAPVNGSDAGTLSPIQILSRPARLTVCWREVVGYLL